LRLSFFLPPDLGASSFMMFLLALAITPAFLLLVFMTVHFLAVFSHRFAPSD
jgi:hypothetical protein